MAATRVYGQPRLQQPQRVRGGLFAGSAAVEIMSQVRFCFESLWFEFEPPERNLQRLFGP